MMNEKLFVVVADGALWELNWRGDLERWVWESHGRPENRRIGSEPGAAMMNRKFFVTVDGHLWERDWRSDLGRWAWQDHGTPPGTTATWAPGAPMQDARLFVAGANGRLFERFWDGTGWVWADRGTPPGTTVSTAPAGVDDTRLFVGGANGHLYEAQRTGVGLSWTDHDRPPGTTVSGTPAVMLPSRVFVTGADGRLYERPFTDELPSWIDHGAPFDAPVGTAPGAAMLGSKVFVGGGNNHMYERFWDGTEWKWVNHGSARMDDARHVVGAPGTDPKLTIAVMGDGFAEEDLDDYVGVVRDQVLGALSSDQLASHQQALRVIRIDVVSMESGVRERRYAEDGSVNSDVFRFSRLGIIPTDRWSSCWFDYTSYSGSRVEKLRRRFAPDADHVIVMVNSQTWGGCSSVGPGNAFFTRAGGWVVIAHECGHNLFELDDEYVDSKATGTFTGKSPRVNTSEQPPDWANLKWRDLVAQGAPLPTDAANPPSGWNSRTSVGAFEGAGGSFKFGLFRPVLECRMNSNDPPWCPVCGRKIAQDLAAFE